MSGTGELGQYYRKTMLYPQKDNQIPFPSGNSGKIDGFFNSLLTARALMASTWCQLRPNVINLSSLPGAPVLHLNPWNTDFFHVSWELTSWSHRFH
ncbi:hypothetical protein, partial [Thiolapillus sp.]|uniref:hypothetical protein n=1 Tax=Thiolapillus sp. TaxID=2017437 RepID=UPI003AF8B965